MLSRQLQINETEDNIVNDHVINDGEDFSDDVENNGWIEGVHDYAHFG